ncbi:MAG: hypothetical protein JSV93_01720 [Candidatus Omnitrophota bacterium]|nr:MAG: hypothetical protein JSV93_01720 [Candidatus Omnitrophota bacterium]
MRKIYFFLIISVILVVTFIAFAFFFFEKEKHRSFLYIIKIADKNSGYTEIDRYKTEDKIIYKSTSFRPKELDAKIIHEKSVFDRKGFKLKKFDKECKNFGVITEVIHIKNNNDKTLDFLAEAGSKFAYLSDMVHAKDISVFDGESIVNYIPFVDRYNFSMGGAQSFNAVYHFPGLLPPARGKIIFTSIRDEYIDALGKKTKTECLVVRAKGIPEAYIWVSKKDRSIVQLEIKSKSLLIKKAAFPPDIAIHDYKEKNKSYDSHNIIFPSEDIALAGTISIPQKGGKLPAVLLVPGEGPYDRENAGLFRDISHELAQGGYITLRFDKRGIGESQGDNTAVSLSTEIRDIESALWFLLNHERIDKDKLFVVAHASACSYLPQLDFSKFPAKGLVMLGLTKPSPLLDFECAYVLNKIKAITEIEEKYPETLELLKTQTFGLIKNTEKEYAFVGGRRVFLKRMHELSRLKPLESFEKLNIALIALYDKKDAFGSPAYIKSVRKALKETEATQFSVMNFRGVGHFFGEIVDEKNMIKHYKMNKEVPETITNWLNERCAGDLCPETLPVDNS